MQYIPWAYDTIISSAEAEGDLKLTKLSGSGPKLSRGIIQGHFPPTAA